MPYRFSPNPGPASQILPQNISHKPFYAVPYEPFDGLCAANTDAIYLSVGLAQWNQVEVSAKVMRFVGNQWSRQAEELPLHRAIDLSILIAKTLFDSDPKSGEVTIRGETFFSQDNRLIVDPEPRTQAERTAFANFVSQNRQLIKDRLNSLCDTLLDLRNRAKI
jgi:hypothetical protein